MPTIQSVKWETKLLLPIDTLKDLHPQFLDATRNEFIEFFVLLTNKILTQP